MWTLSKPEFLWPFVSEKKRLYRQSRVDFYQGKNALSSHTTLNSVININNLDARSTEKNIQFYGLTFGQSIKDTIQKLGKPNYIDKRKLVSKNQKTIYYRLTIKGVKCILQMHYYKDQFFFGKMEISSSSVDIKKDLGQLVCQKYGITSENWTGSIIDSSNNIVLIKDNFIPNMSYISGDKDLFEQIRIELASVEKVNKYRRSGQTELLLDMI